MMNLPDTGPILAKAICYVAAGGLIVLVAGNGMMPLIGGIVMILGAAAAAGRFYRG